MVHRLFLLLVGPAVSRYCTNGIGFVQLGKCANICSGCLPLSRVLFDCSYLHHQLIVVFHPPGCDGGDETAAMTYVRDFGMRSTNLHATAVCHAWAQCARNGLAVKAVEFVYNFLTPGLVLSDFQEG